MHYIFFTLFIQIPLFTKNIYLTRKSKIKIEKYMQKSTKIFSYYIKSCEKKLFANLNPVANCLFVYGCV